MLRRGSGRSFTVIPRSTCLIIIRTTTNVKLHWVRVFFIASRKRHYKNKLISNDSCLPQHRDEQLEGWGGDGMGRGETSSCEFGWSEDRDKNNGDVWRQKQDHYVPVQPSDSNSRTVEEHSQSRKLSIRTKLSTSQSRFIIEAQLTWNTNRTRYVVYQIALLPMTLSDLEGHSNYC